MLCAFCSATGALAQNDFRPGYVVPTGSDTVRGLVDNRSTVALTRQIRFRATAEAPITEYTPAQLQAAGFTPGTAYESLPASGSPAFMAVLAKGSVSLYRLLDANDRTHYYVLSPKMPLTELVQRDTVTEQRVQGELKLVKSRAYPFRQVLAGAFAGCYTITGALARAELKESTLVRLFKEYYTCQGGSSAGVVEARRASKLTFSVLAGVNRTTVNFNDYNQPKNTSLYLSSNLPIFGVGLSFTPSSFSEKLAIGAELLYRKNRIEGYYERSGGGTNTFGTAKVTVDMKWHSVMLPVVFRYTLAPQKAFSPFVQAGMQGSLRLNPMAQYVIREDLLGGSKFEQTNELSVKPFTLHAVVGVGAQISLGHLGAIRPEIRYMASDNASNTSYLSNDNMINFLVAYIFGK